MNQVDSASDAQAVRAVVREWYRAIAAGDLRTMMTFLAEDAVISQAPSLRFTGRDRIRRLYEAAFVAFRVQNDVRVEDVRVLGTMATVLITERLTLVPRGEGGKARWSLSRGILRLRRDAAGQWQVAGRSQQSPNDLLTWFADVR